MLGGWTTNAIAYLSTGVAIASPTSGVSPAYFNQRADMTCDPGKGAPHSASKWFQSSCFSLPASPFVAGNAPAYLDHVRTMGAQDFDLSLFKKFSFGEQRQLRFEVSCYNVANKAQLGMPRVPDMTQVQSQPSQTLAFGSISSTINTPRQFQFGSRFTF